MSKISEGWAYPMKDNFWITANGEKVEMINKKAFEIITEAHGIKIIGTGEFENTLDEINKFYAIFMYIKKGSNNYIREIALKEYELPVYDHWLSEAKKIDKLITQAKADSFVIDCLSMVQAFMILANHTE